MRMSGSDAVTICCIGDAAIRQVEFTKPGASPYRGNLGLVIVVEDNGYGVSTTDYQMIHETRDFHERIARVDGRDVARQRGAAAGDYKVVREAGHYSLARLDRLLPHASSDDHVCIRSEAEIPPHVVA